VKNWTIKKRLIAGFGAVMTVAVALGAEALYLTQQIQRASLVVTEDALPGIINVDRAMLASTVNNQLTINHVATTDLVRKAEIDEEMAENTKKNNEALKAYEASIVQPRDRELYAALAAPLDEMRRIREGVLDLSRAQKRDEALASFENELTPALRKYKASLQELVDYNVNNGQTYAAEINTAVANSMWMTAVGLLLVLGIGSGAAWYVTATTNRSLTASLNELTIGSQQVVSASGQVASSAQALSQGATEQAASLEETSASMEEMASMTRQNSANAQQAATLMAEVDTQVRDSNQALADMVSSMAAIRESSQQVGKIIKTIDEIAFQTNILALNAAVEAARAGEAGMGFAVVADEVRSLAQRSAQAAKDTAALIEASITKADYGNVKVEQVSSAISGITESVTKVKSLVEEVSNASRQQTQGIDQVSQAISQMEKVTQTTAATAEESAAASEELNAQADASMGVVARLEALVVSRGSATAPTAAPAAKRSGGAKVVTLPAARSAKPARSAEEELPMAGTGTFGSF